MCGRARYRSKSWRRIASSTVTIVNAELSTHSTIEATTSFVPRAGRRKQATDAGTIRHNDGAMFMAIPSIA